MTKMTILYSKAKNRLSSAKNCIWKYCNVEKISMFGYKPFHNTDDFKMRLTTMLGEFSKSVLDRTCEADRSKIITSANNVLRNEFTLLGYRVVMNNHIDWHSDFKSGKRWDKKYYRDLGAITGADIKVPWELSRCQHLLWLGEAWLITNEARYAQEVIDEINWWIDDNPLMYSVNWKCAMDVAFRAINWMFALNMISKYDGFDSSFSAKASRSLWQHAFFIRNNFEKQIPYSNNHYASDIVGLLYLGAFFHHSIKGGKWFRLALKEYYSETRTQVLSSGVHYERSVSYHRLMTEMLSYPIYMLKRLNEDIPANNLRVIQKMYDFTSNYTKPNGFAPLVADNDDGRFLPFLNRNFREHNYLNEENSIENLFVSCGNKVLFNSAEQKTYLYSDAGFAILRNENVYLFVCNGGYSKHPKETDISIGTHTHNDLLSFELNINGHDIIVDAGTYLYTSIPSARNEFRSTKKHNTIVVDGEEQNEFVNSFVVKRNVHIKELEKVGELLEGEYQTIKGSLTHRRSFLLSNNSLTITDILSKQGRNHKGKLYLHFAKGIYPNKDKHVIKIQVSDYLISISFVCNDNNILIKDDTISPSFGVLEKSATAENSFEFSNETTIKTIIKWTTTNCIK